MHHLNHHNIDIKYQIQTRNRRIVTYLSMKMKQILQRNIFYLYICNRIRNKETKSYLLFVYLFILLMHIHLSFSLFHTSSHKKMCSIYRCGESNLETSLNPSPNSRCLVDPTTITFVIGFKLFTYNIEYKSIFFNFIFILFFNA